jgi:hypothetical protein
MRYTCLRFSYVLSYTLKNGMRRYVNIKTSVRRRYLVVSPQEVCKGDDPVGLEEAFSTGL